MKIRRTIVRVIVLSIVSFLSIPMISFAYYTKDAAFFRSGLPKSVVGDCYVFISDSVSDYGYRSYVTSAMTGWGSISSADVDFWTSGSATYADIRVYAGDYGLDYAGLAQPYRGSTLVSDPDASTANWSYVIITLNDHYMDHKNYSSANRKKTTIHEFGHALGLRHQPSSTSSVMVQGKRTYSTPQSLDRSNIAYKY